MFHQCVFQIADWRLGGVQWSRKCVGDGVDGVLRAVEGAGDAPIGKRMELAELALFKDSLCKEKVRLDNSKPMSRPVDDASSALYINDPKKGGGFQKLFYTHPPISERIERLKQM